MELCGFIMMSNLDCINLIHFFYREYISEPKHAESKHKQYDPQYFTQ